VAAMVADMVTAGTSTAVAGWEVMVSLELANEPCRMDLDLRLNAKGGWPWRASRRFPNVPFPLMARFVRSRDPQIGSDRRESGQDVDIFKGPSLTLTGHPGLRPPSAIIAPFRSWWL
jgi:hypothetical protein